MIWIHKTIHRKTDYYKLWNDTIIETKLNMNRYYLTVIRLYAPEEGREEVTFFEELQNINEK
jgi:hypothetical protein